jgi:hypothetical protein
VHPGYLLTVDVESEELFLILDAHADDAALNIPKSHDIFLLVDCQSCNLVLMVEEAVLVVDDVSDVSEGFDRAIPGSSDDGLAFGHVDHIDD